MSNLLSSPDSESNRGAFCADCPNKGSYSGRIAPEDLVIERCADGGTSVQFVRPPNPRRGREWRYSIDQGAPNRCELSRASQLLPRQALLLGKAVSESAGVVCADGCAFDGEQIDEVAKRIQVRDSEVWEAAMGDLEALTESQAAVRDM